jgi:hypothetical protein
MQLFITPTGRVRCLYEETLDLDAIGRPTIRRASHVEPTADGQWTADLSPVDGPVLGPFSLRSDALAAEAQWVEQHALPRLGSSLPNQKPAPRPWGGCVRTRPLPVRGGRFFLSSLTTKEQAMTQNELNRAVARATGESVSTIASLGFVPLEDCADREPETVDWDALQESRGVTFQPRRRRTPLVA